MDVDLELLLELVEVFLGSLASPHPAGWGVVKPATSKNSEEIFGKSQFLPNLKKKVCVKAARGTKCVGCSATSFNGGGGVSGEPGGRGELRDGKQKSLNVTPSLPSESESGDI